ncbi:MAG TPA: class I SAM-dependent methyltransferase [Terriglobales bacterium]|nr:class I SAM-dependent methyltransferase [Terriglobales bacterium]
MRETGDLKSAQQASRQRLYPRIFNPNWMVMRRRREIFRTWLNTADFENARVLDVGGRLQPYRELLRFAHRYCSVDLRYTALVSIIARAEQLPFANGSFDLVLCTQMLEYATDPALVVREIHRVLRPRGVLFLSAPSIFPQESEQDRWRFFPAGLRQLLAGFAECEVVPEGGSGAGFLRTLAVFLHMSARFQGLRLVLSYSVVPLINVLALALESVVGNIAGPFTVNYSVRAVK